MPVELNQPVPAFTAQATSGVEVSPDGLRGKQVVLYFYPKDNTPGCTTEGQDFRDLHDQFLACDTLVFGVSRDSLKTHENFRGKQGFPFELICDKDEQLCQLFDVIKQKSSTARNTWASSAAPFSSTAMVCCASSGAA